MVIDVSHTIVTCKTDASNCRLAARIFRPILGQDASMRVAESCTGEKASDSIRTRACFYGKVANQSVESKKDTLVM